MHLFALTSPLLLKSDHLTADLVQLARTPPEVLRVSKTLALPRNRRQIPQRHAGKISLRVFLCSPCFGDSNHAVC